MAEHEDTERVTASTCKACGLCCVSLSDSDRLADVEDDDLERLGPKWVKRNVVGQRPFDVLLSALTGDNNMAIRTRWTEQKAGPLRGVQVCQCVALQGSLLRRTSCSIYERRPRVCREAVKPGDRTCRQLRKLYSRFLETNDPQEIA